MKVIVPLKIFTVTVLYLFQFFSATLQAQTDTLYYQDSIRVTAPEYIAGELTGKLLNIENDTLQLLYSTKTIKLPLNKIKTLEFVSGETTNTWKGALYGGLAGGILTGLLAAFNNSEEKGGIISFTPGEAFALGFLPGGLIGSLFGMVIGSGITSPGWVEVQPQNVIFIPQPRYHSAFTGTSFKHPDRTKKKKFTNSKIIRHDSSKVKVHLELEKTKPVGIKRKSITYKQFKKSKNKWYFDLTLGYTSRGPAFNVEDAMIRDGWDDSKPIYGLFSKIRDEKRPVSETGFGATGVPWTFQGTYKLNHKYDIGFVLSNNPLGETKGYNKNLKKDLKIEYSSFIISTVVHLLLTESFRVGLGPMISFNKFSQSVTSYTNKTLFGALLQLKVIYPTRTTFYAKLDLQFRLIPNSEYGQLIELNEGLKPFGANFTHAFFGLGLGISF